MAALVATAGAVPRLRAREEIAPVLRVGDLQEVAGRKYKCSLSDGKDALRGVLGSQFAEQVSSGSISNGALLKIIAYVINAVGNEDVMMITELEVVAPSSSGSQPMETDTALASHNMVPPSSATPQTASKDSVAPLRSAAPMKENSTPKATPADDSKARLAKTPGISPMSFPTPPNTAAKMAPTPPSMGVSDRKSYHKIGALHPYETNWCIKAKLSRKHQLRSNTIKGQETKILSVELIDDSGQAIQATFWRNQAERNNELLQEGSVYVFSKFKVRPADKKYNNVKCDYQIDFTDGTEVAEAADQDTSAMTAAVEIVPIDQLPRRMGQRMAVDVRGVLLSVGQLNTVKRKTDGSELHRRDITLGDKSGKSVVVTLWQDKATDAAQMLEGNEGCVVQVTQLRISDYNGCSLGGLKSTVVTMDPTDQGAEELKLWHQLSGMTADRFTAVGQDMAGAGRSSGGGGGDRNRFSCLKDVTALTPEALPDDKAAFHNVAASVSMIFSDKDMWYLANPENNKKVVDHGNGKYWCEADGKYVERAENRYVFLIKVADHSSTTVLQVFGKEAEALLGKTANELAALQKDEPDTFKEVLRSAQWRPWSMLVMSKSREYNGNRNVRSVMNKCEPIKWAEEGQKLVALIGRYSGAGSS